MAYPDFNHNQNNRVQLYPPIRCFNFKKNYIFLTLGRSLRTSVLKKRMLQYYPIFSLHLKPIIIAF